MKQAAREKYDADLAELVLADRPDIVICAGWMHILAPSFLDPLAKQDVPVINLHPALPGMCKCYMHAKEGMESKADCVKMTVSMPLKGHTMIITKASLSIIPLVSWSTT